MKQYAFLQPGGFFLHEWANGADTEDWVLIREYARTLFTEAGVSAPFHPGARRETDVHDALQSRRMVFQEQLDFGAGPTTTLRDFVRRIVMGEVSYTWGLPADIQASCLPALRQWAEQTFDLDRPVPIPARISWSVYQKQKN